ncbi:metallophosphoesterase [Microbulbifer celer]|uniref:Metallophosphoesterase n=1 Tax=Microbulbifer celer TaxID=435905 RepID=A0ABW3U6K3_9GAMM|nr:metallophosphoesterase [Microbulbifer celer]UFN58246.1 metallophosphoesterase [Microbulbifer celer]
MSVYWQVGRNTTGRDFVVGDLHGHHQQLLSNLNDLAFDGAKDRLFCVGDIIDRGPDSVELLEMIDQQVYFSILGNHEAMMIAGFEDATAVPLHYSNGGEWFYDLPYPLQQRLVEKVRQWPWAMEIATESGAIGLVHADVPDSSWMEVKRLLQCIGVLWTVGGSLSDEAMRTAAKPLLWNRGLITRLYRELVGPGEGKRAVPEDKQAFLEGLGRFGALPEGHIEAGADGRFSAFSIAGINSVFMGHSYVPVPTTVGNCHFVDTYRGEPDEQLGVVCINPSAA